MSQIGPTVTTKYNCQACVYCKTSSYRVQGDSGHDVECVHPLVGRRFIGDTRWDTPAWCPVLVGQPPKGESK